MKFKAHAFHKALSQAEMSKNVCLELPRSGLCLSRSQRNFPASEGNNSEIGSRKAYLGNRV
jgi:hypothetical protein